MVKSEAPPPKRQKRGHGPQLSAFFKSYKGLDDFHLPIFKGLLEKYQNEHNESHENADTIRILYPGCHRHISASLVFSSVTYVDSDAKVCDLYTDERALAWVEENKVYAGESEITVKRANFDHHISGLRNASFDILISASAGIVSEPCAKYLKVGGYLLASDAHYDARMAFTRKDFRLVAVWDETRKVFSNDTEEYFCVVQRGRGPKEPSFINGNQVQQSIDLPKSKRPFKMVKEGMFFIFEKIDAKG